MRVHTLGLGEKAVRSQPHTLEAENYKQLATRPVHLPSPTTAGFHAQLSTGIQKPSG